MITQHALFPETAHRPAEAEPRGFKYQDEIINEQEEALLAQELGQLDLKPFEFHGRLGNRRVTSFGLRYDYSHRSVETAGDMPRFLVDLLRRAAKFSGYEPNTFRQVGINEYGAGAGIGWHKDKPQFGIIIGVSILAPATMRFRRRENERWNRVSHALKPRSIYLLAGEARTDWEHSIPPLNDLRYSITFRTLAKVVKKPNES